MTSASSNTATYYDYCIIGGGISGIYLAYRILQREPRCKIILLEKQSRFGGRIFTGFIKGNNPNKTTASDKPNPNKTTASDKTKIPVSAGAGRFSIHHRRFVKLIRELGLEKHAIELSEKTMYHHIDKKSGIQRIPQEKLYSLIQQVVRGSKRMKKQELIDLSFKDLALHFLSKEDVKYIVDSFGYYSELVVMNAWDCLRLMDELDVQKNRFYALRGGYMGIIDELVDRIRKLGGICLTHAPASDVYAVSNIEPNSLYCIEYDEDEIKHQIYSPKCIFAVTTEVLAKFRMFRPLRGLLRESIVCAPLCRIYATYPVEKNGNAVWFKGMSRITTNNRVRMIIPISEEDGVIMISYSDHHFADWWKSVYDKEGKRGLKREIRAAVSEAMGMQIPDCTAIEIYHWSHGVGYWRVGVDSKKISRQLVQPFRDLDKNSGIYISNENIAVEGQQWMEGSLEMAENVLDLLRK
jgi:hypothetical protein